MRRIILKLGMLSLPFALLALALAGLAWHVGEALPVERVVESQHVAPGIVYGQERSCNLMAYKLATYRIRKPELLILGNSLMLNLRADYFTENAAAVYNGSVGGWMFSDMMEYYGRTSQLPKLIVLLVDLRWFKGDTAKAPSAPQDTSDRCGHEDLIYAMNKTAHELLSGDLTLQDLLDRRDPVFGRLVLGLRAIRNGTGYRLDGSRRFGWLTVSRDLQAERRIKSINSFAAVVDGRFAPGTQLHEPAFAALDAFLARLKRDGVMVVGITTPFHFEIYDQFRALDSYSYLDKAAERVRSLFDAYGFPYRYVADLRPYGADTFDWYDWQHLTESGSLRLLYVLFQSLLELFDRYVDLAEVRSLLANYTNPMDVLRELDP